MRIHSRVFLTLALVLLMGSPAGAAQFPEARIYIEYNSTDNDLGFHVFLDAEDWEEVTIVNPRGGKIFEVEGRGAFARLGMTELFFEGAEPSLDEFPLEELLALFPEGRYTFIGETVEGGRLMSRSTLTYNVPEGPVVFSEVNGSTVKISWQPVTGPADILPDGHIVISGYQVIVGSFQVTVPATTTSVTVPREYIESLDAGVHDYEVLAIEEGGNQTITSSTFSLTF
jgi:hypothetical protein